MIIRNELLIRKHQNMGKTEQLPGEILGRRLTIGPRPPMASTAPLRMWAWDMSETSDDEAEILLYGDILSEQPIDWWTGEPIPGNYITPEGFLEDLEPIKNKDRITVRINSPGGDMWDGWSPGNGDDIKVVDGVAQTGKMWVESVKPENGLMALRAFSIPPTAKDKSSKSWENVKLLQLGQEIAGRHGLAFESYDVTDQLYEYVRQDDLPDFLFLEQRCALEGVAFLVFDGTLVMYGEAALEAKTPAGTIKLTADSNFQYNDDAAAAYGKCEVVNGNTAGTFAAASGSSKLLHKVLQVRMSSQAEANRFAAGLLRYENKNTTSGTLPAGILRDYAAGSVANIKTAGAGSWDGPAFIYRIRHDYVAETSKLFFRKPLEGY